MQLHTHMGGLEVEIFQQSAGAPRAAVILCHGFGAPGDDLVGLAPALVHAAPALADVRFHFPAAPLSLGELGWGDSRAWWMIDMVAIQKLQTNPAALREFRKQEPEGMAAARKAVHAVVQKVLDSTGLAMSKVVLGGFSQGAMITTDVALRTEEAAAGLCVLSGTLLLEDAWREKARARSSLHVFQSHGRQDPVLPYEAATWLQDLLVQAGLQHEFVPFAGGHTIPAEVLSRLATFLERRLA
ncbi:MAG: phospholipase [Myxococcaceae bacterium]